MNTSEQIFRQRFLPLYPRLYAVARVITGNESDAADAVQDAMEKIWSRISSLADVKSPLGYSLTIVRTSAIDITRKRNTVELSPTLNDESDNPVEPDSVEFLYRAINTLPAQQREAIRLSALANLSADEIAAQMNISDANVRQLLSRARRKLKDIIQNNL